MSLALWQSIPFACILLPLFSAAVTSVLPRRAAKAFAVTVLAAVTALSAVFLAKMVAFGESYTYMMGHYPAPWGNELRAGPLEALIGLAFALVELLCVLGGLRHLEAHILPDRHSLYMVMLLLLCAALQAEVYTNDVFTAYVFVEIMTLAAAALIAAHTRGRTLVAATRYMVMNLVGSALFLLSIILLYDLTGHLLMSPMKEQVAGLAGSGSYHLPLTVVIALMTVGLSIKSALFPFHTWVPDAYGTATPTSSAVLSSLVSKAYIFLLLKLIWRVLGEEVFSASHVSDVLLAFGLTAMILGSVDALRQRDVRRMAAYSSVAQIGYIYTAIGLGGTAGAQAAMFHLLAHTAAKALLFIAISGMTSASGDSKRLQDLEGAGYRCVWGGIGFTVGALSMVGVPFLGGFPAKVYDAQAAIAAGDVAMWLTLIALTVSTALNAAYFLRVIITLYRRQNTAYPARTQGCAWHISVALFVLLNLAMGLLASPVMAVISDGIQSFG